MHISDFEFYLFQEYFNTCPAPLSRQETDKLMHAYKDYGDMEAYDALLKGHCLFAAQIVFKRYGVAKVTYDLMQNACLVTLPEALEKYRIDNPTGAAFTTYAYRIIMRNASQMYFDNNAMVADFTDADRRHAVWLKTRYDELVQSGYSNNEAMEAVTAMYADKYRRRPFGTMKARAQRELELKICRLIGLTSHPLSMDYALADDADADYTLINNIEAPSCYNPDEIALEAEDPLHVALAEALMKLPKRDRNIVLMHAGIGQKDEVERTFDEIGEYYKVSRQYVSKVYHRAIKFLREQLEKYL